MPLHTKEKRKEITETKDKPKTKKDARNTSRFLVSFVISK